MLRTSLTLLGHQWRAGVRSVVRPQNTAATVVLSLLVAILALNLLSLGLGLDRLLTGLDPGVDPVAILNGAVLYYVALDLVLRLWFQRIPGQVVRPYLLLPVPRSTLVHLLLGKSLLTLFNLLPLLVIIPVSLRIVGPMRGQAAAVGWVATLVLVLLISSLGIFYLKKRELSSPWAGAGLLVLLGITAALDVTGALSLRGLSVEVVGAVMDCPYLAPMLLAVLALLYRANVTLLRAGLTVEAPRTGGVEGRGSFRMLERRGGIWRLVALELKMLTRNRRPRAMLALAVAMVPLLIAFEAYWLHTMPDRRDIYPLPGDSVLLQDEALRPTDPTLQRVTFDLVSRSVPEDAWPYVTGSDPALGSWDPAVIPLLPGGQGRWQRVVYLPRDSLIEYRLTLGSWDAHRLHADGSRPPRGTLLVARDTTLALTAERWRYPLVFTLVDINLIYIGILLTGFFLLTYGQLLLGWDAGYLEGIVVRPVSALAYLKAKHGILVSSVAVSCLLTLPLGLLKPWFVMPNVMLALYNAGVNALVLMLIALFSTRPVDLNASVFSMQGKGAVQILALAPVLLIPLLVYAVCALAGVASWVYWILGAAGAAALVAHRRVLERAAALFVRRKHRTVAMYRMS